MSNLKELLGLDRCISHDVFSPCCFYFFVCCGFCIAHTQTKKSSKTKPMESFISCLFHLLSWSLRLWRQGCVFHVKIGLELKLLLLLLALQLLLLRIEHKMKIGEKSGKQLTFLQLILLFSWHLTKLLYCSLKIQYTGCNAGEDRSIMV